MQYSEYSPAFTKAVAYPPGGLLIWLVIALELFTFGASFVFFLLDRAANPEVFAAGSAHLSTNIAVVNTLLLVTSGFLVAQGVIAYKRQILKKASRLFVAGAVLGTGFLVLKMIEYRAELMGGHGLGSDIFFTYYWLLTGFHFLHVLIGVFILLGVAWLIKKGRSFDADDLGVETAASFWHMCDLIWVLLFPLLYILT